MKDVIRKSIVLLLVLAMTAAMLTGCGDKGGNDSQSNGGTGDNDSQSSSETEIVDGKYTNPVTVNYAVKADSAMKFPEGDSYDDNVWTRYIEEELGIKLEVAWSADGATEAYGNKLTMSVANDDLPDIFSTYYETYAEAARAGMLADMTDLIEEYGSDRLKAIFAENEELIEACKIDGKLYCIPQLGSSSELNAQFLWIRQDWLDAVNMEAPTTWDELVAVARAFTTQDPDGNGVDDTFGLGLSGTSPWWGGIASFEGIAQAFHASGSETWIKDASGQIVYGGIQPEMKNALAAASEMYKEGLLDPEFMTKDVDAVIADIYSNKIGMAFGMNYAGYWPLLSVVEENSAAVWKPYAFVSSDDTPASCSVWWPLDTYTCVSSKCANPEAAVLIANLYVETNNDETPAEVSEKYVYSGETSVYMCCPVRLTASASEFETYRRVKAIEEGTMTADELTGLYKTNYDAIQAYLNGDTSQYGYWSQLGLEGAAGIVVDDYIPNDRIILTEIHGGFPEEVSGEMGLIKSTEIEYYAKIISGALSVDAFDDWVAEFNTLGGEKVTQAVNDAYNN